MLNSGLYSEFAVVASRMSLFGDHKYEYTLRSDLWYTTCD